MLIHFIATQHPQFLATYTRNPAILRILESVCGQENVFPLCDDEELCNIAENMPYAQRTHEQNTGELYHIGRYGNGLYSAEKDPACTTFSSELPLTERYAALHDPGTALVVTARVNQNNKVE